MSYNASDIEVLSGLEPVRRRPGMYTDTSRPNHLAHEVVDNSVDEALGGHAKEINVTLHKDNSLSVADDGRGMPVDIHPKEKVSGVELILTRLHAGGKFNDKNYEVSGGLHGVGVSVVNALSKQLECWIKRNGKEYNISFKDGKVSSKLEVVGTRRPAQYRHHGALLAGSEVLRLGQVLGPAAQACAQGQGRAVPGPQDHLRERSHQGEGRVVLHRRSRRLSQGRNRQGRRAAGRAHLREERPAEGQRRRIRARVDARTPNARWARATSTSFRPPKAART